MTDSEKIAETVRLKLYDEADRDVHRFFSPMTWDQRRRLFVKHMARYLGAYDHHLISWRDLGEILDMFVVGFDSKYKEEPLLANIPDIVQLLAEGDGGSKPERAVLEFRSVCAEARRRGWISAGK